MKKKKREEKKLAARDILLIGKELVWDVGRVERDFAFGARAALHLRTRPAEIVIRAITSCACNSWLRCVPIHASYGERERGKERECSGAVVARHLLSSAVAAIIASASGSLATATAAALLRL